ncbi:MAG: nuclear transport factor 2 family protein [Deinococcota bacterium]
MTVQQPREVIERLQQAINQHDLESMVACFEEGYRSEFPAHPERAFRGNGQVRRNWAQIFATVPDLRAELLGCTADGPRVWAEWEWTGHRADGSPYLVRGVTVQGVQDGRIAWGRLYMELVQPSAAPPGVSSDSGEERP